MAHNRKDAERCEQMLIEDYKYLEDYKDWEMMSDIYNQKDKVEYNSSTNQIQYSLDDYIEKLFPDVVPDPTQNRLICKLQSDFWILKGNQHKAELQATFTPDSKPTLRKVPNENRYFPRIEGAYEEMRHQQEAVFQIYYPYLYELITKRDNCK